MNKIVLFGCLLIFFGCSSGVSKEDLSLLNGYWEIGQVVFPDGNSKEYQVNITVDYIQLEGMEGLRKKVRPRFDGTYETSDDAETFVILESGDGFTMNYRTGLSEWSEKLVALDEETFSVVNADGLRYDYKRFEPIAVER